MYISWLRSLLSQILQPKMLQPRMFYCFAVQNVSPARKRKQNTNRKINFLWPPIIAHVSCSSNCWTLPKFRLLTRKWLSHISSKLSGLLILTMNMS